MRSFGMHIDLVQSAMNDLNANVHREEVITASNAAMGTLAGKFPIGLLCRKKTITSDADGSFLPTNLAGITVVRETSTGRRVWSRGAGAAGADESIYRYYEDIDVAAESDTSLPFAGAGSISADGNEITCAALLALADTETLAGLTLVIHNVEFGSYYYEIDEVAGGKIILKGNHPYLENDVTIQVRPNQTKRIHFVNAEEAAIASTEFDVYYWIYPNPMSLDSDVIPLVYPDVLELITIRRIPETKDRRPVGKSEIEDAIKIARKAEPDQSVPVQPLTEQGNVFTLNPDINRIPYKRRGE